MNMKEKILNFKKALLSLFTLILSACSPTTSEQPQMPANNEAAENSQTETEQATPPPQEQPTPQLEQISSAKTPIADKIKSRNTNLEIALKTINGVTINPGETFSFNATLGERTAKKGYKKAIAFDEDENKVKMLGGGICQVSTTVYQAAMSAGLEINERHSHTREVPYARSDEDATVAYGGFDLKFTNNKDKPIKISASKDNNYVYIKLIKVG
jgi:vancomycin resistance protein YoaR